MGTTYDDADTDCTSDAAFYDEASPILEEVSEPGMAVEIDEDGVNRRCAKR